MTTPSAVDRPVIALMVTGGTIDGLGRHRLDLAAYQETGKHLDAEAMLARVPEVEAIADVQLVGPGRFLGPRVGLGELLDLLRQATEILADPDVDGLVMTRGTNTLEEVAFLAHLTLATHKPVVFVGAMRPASGMSSDGELNLVNAIRVAAEPASREHGVLVLLNDRIYSARDVTKGATYRIDAFTGRDLGPLGYADADGRVVFYHRHLRAHTFDSAFDLGRIGPLPRVDVVVSYVGADGVLIDAAVAAGARGLVSAGMGAGFPTAAEMEGLERAAAAGVTVCIGSRVGSGRVVARPAVTRRGFVAVDNLVPWKARILLALCLAHGMTAGPIQAAFDRH